MADEELDRARSSLERVQQFDTLTLPREPQLGEALNFGDAVDPAKRIINLFRQYPIEFLPELPDNQLQTIITNSDSFFNILEQILNFDPTQPDAYSVRTNIIESLKGQYQNYFNQLQQLISYGASRQRDFTALERDFRASMQRAADEAAAATRGLEQQEADARRILDEVRKVAAEQGVSQQARYFQEEGSNHEKEAIRWRNRTIYLALGIGVYAILSLFFHKIPWLAPTTPYEEFQLGLSKILIFLVLAYVLLLCSRNFLANKHNGVINRHRQNALLTFNALVEAAGKDENRDVVLTYAAACIFSPQETGYTKAGASGTEMPLSIIQALPKLSGS